MHDIKKATVKALPQILDWIDAENARRETSHKRPIRIIQAPSSPSSAARASARGWRRHRRARARCPRDRERAAVTGDSERDGRGR